MLRPSLVIAIGSGSAWAITDPWLHPASHVSKPTVMAIVESWQNTRGGVETGSQWNSLVDAKVEMDAAVFVRSWPGAFVAQIEWVDQQSSDDPFFSGCGAFSPVSNIMGNRMLRVLNLNYSVRTGSGWTWNLGQIAADDRFMVSTYGGHFLNATFGAMASQTSTPLSTTLGGGSAFSIWPVLTPGVWFQTPAPAPTVWQTGLYYGGPGPDVESNHGFRYRHDRACGLSAFSEVAHLFALAGRTVTARFGGAVHSGEFDDLRAQARGATGTRRGLFCLYTQHDIVLVRDGGGAAKVGGFLRGGVSPQEGRTVVVWDAQAGVAWFGPLPGRPRDVAGLAYAHTRFGRFYSALNNRPRNEGAMELTYEATLTQHLMAQADLQALTNPAANAVSGRRETALVAGLRVSVVY